MIRSAPKRRSVLLGLMAVCATTSCRHRVRDAHVLRVGSSPTGAPFSFVDPLSNQLTGSIVDTAQAILGAVHERAEMLITPFSALIPSLTIGKIDMIAAAMVRTPAREAIVAFSDPVYGYAGGLVVRQGDAAQYPSLQALKGLRVGAQVGTRYVDQLREAGVANVATYDGLNDILRDIEHDRIDAGFGDRPILAYQLRVGPHRPVKLAQGFNPPPGEQLCLIMRRGDPLLPVINTQIARLKTTTIPAINARWGL
jgi:polar amino acid transport system substrate-binding protein